MIFFVTHVRYFVWLYFLTEITLKIGFNFHKLGICKTNVCIVLFLLS